MEIFATLYKENEGEEKKSKKKSKKNAIFFAEPIDLFFLFC